MTDPDWMPQSCTLPTEEQPLRIAEWDGLLTERLTALSRPGPQRLGLELSDSAATEDRVRDLAAREGHARGYASVALCSPPNHASQVPSSVSASRRLGPTRAWKRSRGPLRGRDGRRR